ncbi:hypothetical protein C1646_775155 [Rhizophagus diaphanus]|nr:hypothetical protein C1646_775155 [Rhizophagus diaphanus] [Rhizophagus sp. MUCL 43196]
MAKSPVENQEIIEKWPTQNIAKFGKYLTASEIQYYLEFQEYLNMFKTGFANIGTTRKVKNCDFFPGIKVSKEQRQYLSVKICEFASKELDTGHTSVDFTQPIFKNIFDANKKFHEKAII